MLEIKNLSYKYRMHGPLVLANFSMTISAPGIYGLLGPNGAGKSTLLYSIMGMLTPKTGSVELDGVNTRLRQPQTLSCMFLVPEEFILPAVSLERYITLNAPLYPNFSREVMDDCLREFDFPGNHNLKALSMGQKKKVFISFAIACGTPVLLMDEPTNGLDIQAKAAFRRLMARYIGDDRRVVISTHQVRDLEQLLDRILIMDRQQVLFDHTVDQIQRRLRFIQNVPADSADQALYKVPAPGGFDAVFYNTDPDNVTDVNLELLFDFVLRAPQQVDLFFNPERVASSNSLS